jgi:hypothetical protein
VNTAEQKRGEAKALSAPAKKEKVAPKSIIPMDNDEFRDF